MRQGPHLWCLHHECTQHDLSCCVATPCSEGLDWVINEARESGIRLILTLTDSRGDYGGMPEYVRAVMGEQGSITDFYTSKNVRVRP